MSEKPFDCGTLFSPQKGKCFDINGEVFVCGEVVSPTADGIVKGKIYSSNNFTAAETLRMNKSNASHRNPSAPSNLPNISLLNSLSDDCQSTGNIDKYKVTADATKEQKDSNPKWRSSIFKHLNCSVGLLQAMTQTKNSLCCTNGNVCPQCEQQTLVVNSKPFATFSSLPPFCTTCKAYFVNEDDNPKDLETLRDALMGDDGPSSILDCRPSRGKIVMLPSKKEFVHGNVRSTTHECQDDHLSRHIIISPSSGSVSEDLTASERTIQNNGLPEMVHPITYDGYDEDSIVTLQSELLSVYSEEEEHLLHQDIELVHAIASREISKHSAENCKMTSNCERCSMPRMEINGIAKCVTCPKLLLKAQQNARTRRLCAREKLVTMNFIPRGAQPSIPKRPMVFDFGFIPTSSTSDSDKANVPVSVNGCNASETNSTNIVSIGGWSELETNSNNPTSIHGWSTLGTNSCDDDNKLIQDSIATHSEISQHSAGQRLTVSIENEDSNASKGMESASNCDMIVVQSIEDDCLAGEIKGIEETDIKIDEIVPTKMDQETAILVKKESYPGGFVDDADKSNSLGVARDCCAKAIATSSGPSGVEEMHERKEMANLDHNPSEVSDEVSFAAPGTLENTYDEKQENIDLKQDEIGEYSTTRTIQKNGNSDGVSSTEIKKACMYRNDMELIQMEGDNHQVSSSEETKIDREIDKRKEKFEESLCEASSKRRFEHQMNAHAIPSESPRRILDISSDLSFGGGSQDFATPRMNNLHESGHNPLRICERENKSNAHVSEVSAIAYGGDQLRHRNEEKVQQGDQSFVGAHKEESTLSTVNTQLPQAIHPISTFSPSKYIANRGDPRTTLFIEGSANPNFSKGYPYPRYRSEETPEGSIECLLQEHKCDLKDIASVFRKRDNSATSYCPSILKGSVDDGYFNMPSLNSQRRGQSSDEVSRFLTNNKIHESCPVPPILGPINFDSLRNSEFVKKIPFSPIAAAQREARETRLLSDHTKSNQPHPQQLDMTDVHTRRNFRFDESILEAMPHNTSAFEHIPVPSLFSNTCNNISVKSASPLRQSANQPSQAIPSQIITDSSRGDMLYFEEGRNHRRFNDCKNFSEEISKTSSFAMDLFSMMEDYRNSQKSRDENDKLSFRQIPMGDSDTKSDYYTISTSTTSTTASTLGSQDCTLGLKQIESVESKVDVERLSYLMQRLGQVAKEIESLDETIEREERFADDQSLV